LQLPVPVTDLKATRTSDQVVLTWTTSKETTDKLKLKRPVPVRICVQTTSRECDTVGNIQAAPGQPASFTHTLPPALTQGPLRTITYQVFLQNAGGSAAGASNDAPALAGAAPQPVTGLTAQVAPQGVLLHWAPVPDLPPGTVFEIHRTWLNPPAKNASASSSKEQKNATPGPAMSGGPVPPVEQTLQVQAVAQGGQSNSAAPAKDPGAALDTDVQANEVYRYTVARVMDQTAKVADKPVTMRIEGPPSQPLMVWTKDVFPPATPQRLAAVVASAAMTGGAPTVDLSWSANTEADFAQYQVYRRDLDGGPTQATERRQIAPAPNAPASRPLVTPAFQDTQVRPGHRYAYSVTAVDTSGNASQPTPEVMVEVPQS
jgi:hypothetical protein